MEARDPKDYPPAFCLVQCLCLTSNGGGALKERRNGHAGKRSSKHLKMDNNKLSTKNPQLDSSGKIHTYWIKATCDSRFCGLDVSEQKTYSLELTDRLPRHGPSDWDTLTKDERSVFQLDHIYLEQNTRTPMKTRMDSSKHSEAICVRDAGEDPATFLDNQSFRTRSVLSKTCQWTLQNAVMDSPFCSWTVRSAETRSFGENCSSPTGDFGSSKMRGCCLGRIIVGVPSFALGICLSTFEWRFLLWTVNNQLVLCVGCTLEEGC